MTDSTPRQQIRNWWYGAIEGKEGIDIKTLADQGTAELLPDRAFCDQFLAAFLRPMVYDVGLNLLSAGRSQGVSNRTVHVTSKDIADVIEASPIEWSHWMEYDPTTGRHIALFAMEKEQALAAAKAREKRADPDLRRAALLRLAAGPLAKGQRIDERWTVAQLAEIEAKLELEPPKYSLGKGTIYELMAGAAD